MVTISGLLPHAFGALAMTALDRVGRVVLLALVLSVGACRQGGDEAEVPTEGDSTAVVGPTDSSVADPATTDSSGVAPSVVTPPLPGDSTAVATTGPTGAANPPTTNPASQQLPTDVAGQLAQIIASQAALNQRLDSLAGQVLPADSARGIGASGQVLGQAGQQVRSFGVGVVWSIVVVILFNISIRALVWVLDTLAERNASRRLFYKRLVPIIRIVLWVFAAYLIISVIFRVDAQGIFAAAAAVGVAVGFAAQDLLKNLFGGLILVFDQPFQAGDKISVGGTYGEVVSIGLRSTRIVTPDDNLVSVPNAQVVDQQVANANAGELNCQVVTDLYLPGWADEVVAKRIAFQAAASSKYVYLNKPIVTLVADVFKETFLTRVRVKAYVLDPRLEFLFQSDVTERARAGFREAGLLTPEHMHLSLIRRSAAPPWDEPAGSEESREVRNAGE